MPILFLLCGLPGSGKTTLARQLEAEHAALRLSPDEWIVRLYGDKPDKETLDKARAPVETLQWDVAARTLTLGVNVILEFGFWSRNERDDYRARARELGVEVKVIFLDVPREVLLARLKVRNENLPPGTFHVTEAQLDAWSGMFEAPGVDEMEEM